MNHDSFCDGCINETCRGCPIYEEAVKDDNDDEHDEDGEQE